MKALPGHNINGFWSSNFVEEVAYIKQHLKYKPKLSRFIPAIFSGVFLILLVILVAASVYYKAENGEPLNLFNIVMFASILVMFLGSIFRYLQSLKFISIPTEHYLAENSVLIQGFLRDHHFASSRHPEIPEVFQMLSRNISAGKEDREVLIFIADDKRILINSHFTNSWSFFPSKRHHAEISKMLKEYINNQAHTTGLMHQTF
jgi:hypothetical protein